MIGQWQIAHLETWYSIRKILTLQAQSLEPHHTSPVGLFLEFSSGLNQIGHPFGLDPYLKSGRTNSSYALRQAKASNKPNIEAMTNKFIWKCSRKHINTVVDTPKAHQHI